MSRTIAVIANKGGIAKTTSVLNLGAALACRGRRVLVVDADPQGDLTQALGGPPDAENTLSRVLQGRIAPESALIQAKNVFLIPAGADLAATETTLAGDGGSLRRFLTPLARRFDYVLIDTPRGLGLLTLNALVAAGELLLLTQAEYWSLRQLGVLLSRLRLPEVRRLNPRLRILGILPTMYLPRTRHGQEAHGQLVQELGADYRIFEPVPRTIQVADAAVAGLSVTEYAPASGAAAAYLKLAQEVDA